MSVNPTDTIDVSLLTYINQRKVITQSHLEGGIPDYAYGSDYVLRQKINAIPGVYRFFKALTNQVVPYLKQQINLTALKVGPDQFPEVYQITQECARRLGIGMPTIFVQSNMSEMNAGAYCFEDDSPLITITSGLLERFTKGELKVVIGHECGHVHNNHLIYTTAVNTILQSFQMTIPGVRQIIAMGSAPIQYALMAWSRAAEVTCDRAGIICSDSFDDEISSKAKFLYGAAFDSAKVNVDAILKQYDMLRQTPVRLLEMQADHPIPVRRIFASKEFFQSEVLYQWRPELKTPGMSLISKQELDARCEKYIGVLKSGKRG